MQSLSATILKVEQGTTKNQKTIFNVALSDGQSYATFKKEVADEAFLWVGKGPVTVNVTVSQNGQYTNRYFEGVAQGQQPAQIPVAAPQQQGGRSPEVEARIVRQSSMATAFNFVGHVLSGSGDIEAATGHALALAKDIFNHAFHGSSRLDGASEAPVVAQNGSEVAAQVNQVLEGAVSVGATTPTPDW